MTPREIMNAYKGFQWMRARQLKDIAWMTANIANLCGPPAKHKKNMKTENFIRPSRDTRNYGNPFYLDLMGI